MRLNRFASFNNFINISIHAPLTGCDRAPRGTANIFKNFNPRTPYGMRLDEVVEYDHFTKISIHAPLTGCDLKA